MLKTFGKVTYKAAATGLSFLARGKLLNKKEGAAFLNPSEVSAFLSPREKGLLIDGDNLRLSEKESFQNLLLAARVGAGKTTKYVIPNVLDKSNKLCSLVVHDPKGEVNKLTSGYMEAKGFNVVVFNPNDITNTNCFNPFTEAKTEIELEQIAETIIWSGNPNSGDQYWNNGATRILSVLIKCLSFGDKKYFNMPNLHHLLQNFGETGEGLAKWIAHNCWNPQCPDDDYVLQEWKGALTGNEEAIQSFVGICLTAMKSLSNRQLKQFFSKSDYDLKRLRDEKTIIYFITPAEHQKYYSFVTSLFFRSVFNECMRREHLAGRSLPVYLLYDEFGNSFVTDFVSVANTIRGYHVSLSVILQSVSQLADKYGKTTAEAIQGAFNTSMCYDSSDPATADHFSNLSGKVRETQIRMNGKEKSLLDTSTDYREYNLLNSNEVRTMQQNEALIISKNRNPVKLKITPYYKNRRMKKMARFEPTQAKNAADTQVHLVDIRESHE